MKINEEAFSSRTNQKKVFLSPQQESNLWPSRYQLDALITELWETCGERVIQLENASLFSLYLIICFQTAWVQICNINFITTTFTMYFHEPAPHLNFLLNQLLLKKKDFYLIPTYGNILNKNAHDVDVQVFNSILATHLEW